MTASYHIWNDELPDYIQILLKYVRNLFLSFHSMKFSILHSQTDILIAALYQTSYQNDNHFKHV